MPVDDSLRFFVKQAIPADDLGLRLFLQRSARGTLRFIIDPEQAQEDVKLDFLSFHHPMIRAISDYYTKHQDELHPVSYLRLQSPDLEKGKYLWLLYLTEITGARPAKDLECVAARIDDGKILDEDESNAFIPLLMSSAGSVPPGERERVQVPEQIVHRVDDTAVERLNKRFQDRQRNNEALVSSWLATLDESFSRTLLVRQERLEVARSRNRKPHYIRMLEGAIRNLESDHSAKRARLEVGRRLDRSLALRGAGIVEVSNG
jgi:hypothetical protein